MPGEVAFLAVREADMPRYAARGLHGFYLGDEAIVAATIHASTGRAMKSVRAAVPRVGAHSRFKVMRETEASGARARSSTRSARSGAARRPSAASPCSSAGHRGARQNPEFLIASPRGARRQAGRVPAHRPGLRRGPGLHARPDAPPSRRPERDDRVPDRRDGARARPGGFTRLSMNFAMWGRLFEEGVHFTISQRLAKRPVDVLNPFFQIKSLHDFNAKFDPEWSPRSIVMEAAESMPKVGVLYASVEGFLTIPLIGSRARALAPRRHRRRAGRALSVDRRGAFLGSGRADSRISHPGT